MVDPDNAHNECDQEIHFLKARVEAIEAEAARYRGRKGKGWKESYELAIRHCETLVKSWTVNQELLLKAGEMTAQELRTVKAVLNSILWSMESMRG